MLLRAGGEVLIGAGLALGACEVPAEADSDGPPDGRGASVGGAVGDLGGEAGGAGGSEGVAWAAASSGIPACDALVALSPPDASATARAAPATTIRLTAGVRLRRNIAGRLRMVLVRDCGAASGSWVFVVAVAEAAVLGLAAAIAADPRLRPVLEAFDAKVKNFVPLSAAEEKQWGDAVAQGRG